MQQSRYWVIICGEKEEGKKGREWSREGGVEGKGGWERRTERGK